MRSGEGGIIATHSIKAIKYCEQTVPFYVGGHTMCCQAIKVKTKQGTAIFPGDTIFYYGNLEKNHSIGLNLNLIECYACMACVPREADVFMPAHDPEVLRRYPDGQITHFACWSHCIDLIRQFAGPVREISSGTSPSLN